MRRTEHTLNIKVIVLNNAALGMITQFQHLYFDNRMAGTTAQGGYITPDMTAIAKAYGFKYIELTEGNVGNIWTIVPATEPVMIDYQIDGLTTVSPKLEYNKPIYKPTPLI